jgi:hypothetical protein
VSDRTAADQFREWAERREERRCAEAVRDALIALRERWNEERDKLDDERMAQPPGESRGFDRGMQHAERILYALIRRAMQ